MDAPWLSIAAYFRARADTYGVVGVSLISKAAALVEPFPSGTPEQIWNAAFVGACLRLSGYESSGGLDAGSYHTFGRTLRRPRSGCVVMVQGLLGDLQVGFCQSVTGGIMQLLAARNRGEINVTPHAAGTALAFRWPQAIVPLPIDTDLPTIRTLDPDNAPPHLSVTAFDIGSPISFLDTFTSADQDSRRRQEFGPIVQSVVIGRGTPNLDAVTTGFRDFALGKRDRTAMVVALDEPTVDASMADRIRPQVLGTHVASLQHSLNTHDFDTGTVDGVFGPRTQNALLSFQKEAGVAVSGIPDAPTWKALSIGRMRVPNMVTMEAPGVSRAKSIRSAVTYSDTGPSNVDLFFATTRQPDARKPTIFTDDRCDELSFGRLAVTVPPNHVLGGVERPPVFLTIQWRPENPRKDFIINTRSRLDREEFINGVKGWGQDQALVFVHGFNTRFDDAAYRMAQIVYDLQFNGVPVLFSWPSRGGVLAYFYDRDSAVFSRDGFTELLGLLLGTGISTVHVIAHSMGNQIAVDTLSTKGVLARKLAQVILAAPDVDRDVFRLRASRINTVAERVTLYASRYDRALQLSRRIAESPRAGDVPDGLPLIVPHLDTIDASAIGEEMFGLGHTICAKNRSIIDDIGRTLDGDGPPHERSPQIRGMPLTAKTPSYWRYPD